MPERNLTKEPWSISTGSNVGDSELVGVGVPFVPENPGWDMRDGKSRPVVISPFHGRSKTDSLPRCHVLWSDEFGLPYGSRDWKGSRLPDFSELVVGANGYVKGGMSGSNIHRIQSMSYLLRSNGLPTEWIVGVHQVDRVLLDGVQVEIGEFWMKTREESTESLRRSVLDVLSDGSIDGCGCSGVVEDLCLDGLYYLLTELSSGSYGSNRNALMMLLNEVERLKQVRGFGGDDPDKKLVVVERCMPVSERLTDMMMCKTVEELEVFLNPIFRWWNTVAAVQRELIPGVKIGGSFRVNKISDLERFIVGELPRQMGAWLGKLHGLGFCHKSAHAQNWLVVGCLVDLDSVEKSEGGFVRGEVELSLGVLSNILSWWMGLQSEEVGVDEVVRVWSGFASGYMETFLDVGDFGDEEEKGCVSGGLLRNLVGLYPYPDWELGDGTGDREWLRSMVRDQLLSAFVKF